MTTPQPAPSDDDALVSGKDDGSERPDARVGANRPKTLRRARRTSARAATGKETPEQVVPVLPTSELTRSIVSAAVHVAKDVSATTILTYVDTIEHTEEVLQLIDKNIRLILVARDDQEVEFAEKLTPHVLSVPPVNLTRMGQIKMATLMAFSQRILSPGEILLCLVGVVGRGLDTLMVMSVGEEYEMFRTIDQPKITEHIRRAVFQRVLTLVIELAGEGREGKPVGALFVVGDHEEVAKYCHQTIINPFKGYPEAERNILDENMRETVKEFCSIDGAFVISGKGTIVSAGTTLRTALSEQELPQGLGSRHAAAAAITASTMSIAITLSESTGTVRVWRRGQMITEIEKAVPAPSRTSGMMLPPTHDE